MPPAEPTSLIPSVAVDGCTPANAPGKGPPDWLSTVQLPASAIFAIQSSPMALWSDDRSHCIFGRPTGRLLGFPENELWANKECWLARIDRRDRKRVLRSWQARKADSREQVRRYLFWPLNGSPAILLEETSHRLIAASDNQLVVLCHYQGKTARPGKSKGNPNGHLPMRDLIHQIGNNLQAVRGEVELLRLFGELPPKSFENIMRGINSIHELAAQMEAVGRPNGDGVSRGDEAPPFTGAESARDKNIKGV